MGKGIFITGTDTDVGKTYVTGAIAYILNTNGFDVTSYKPVQSGGDKSKEGLIATDAAYVKSISGINDSLYDMNTYCFTDPVSPHIASERDKEAIEPIVIKNRVNQLFTDRDYVLVEGAGGLIVPLRRNYMVIDLIQDLNIPVLVVARSGVGTINHTVLTINQLRSMNVDIKGIVFNNYTGTYYEEDNINMIKSITGIDNILTLKKSEDMSIESTRENYRSCFTIDEVLKLFK